MTTRGHSPCLPQHRRALIALAVAAGACLAAVAASLVLTGSVPGDDALLRSVHDAIGRDLDGTARAVGIAGTAWVIGPLALGLAVACVLRRAWAALLLVLTAAVLTWLVNPILKRLFERERPDVRELGEPSSRFAFPSGHAVASVAIATVVVMLAWHTRMRWPVTGIAIVMVLLVGMSRLVLGVHHPSDLLAGALLAIAVICAAAAGAADRAKPTPRSPPRRRPL